MQVDFVVIRGIRKSSNLNEKLLRQPRWLFFKLQKFRSSLPFTTSGKKINNDQQGIYEKCFTKFSLGKCECAEQQTKY